MTQPPDDADRVQALEKENRRLQKQLTRANRNLDRFHRSREHAEALLGNIIAELKTSQTTLELRSQELEQALSELQTMQSRLIMSEKMSALGELVAGVAHEINNPVSFIYGNVNHARGYMADLLTILKTYRTAYPQPVAAIQDCLEDIDLEFVSDDFPKVMDSMQTGAERIKEIVLSLKTFSHMDQTECKVIDLHTGLDSTLVILASRLKGNPPRPTIMVNQQYGSLPPIHCYAGQINQVFMNILSNAIDALEASATPAPMITIVTAYEDEQAVITIRDNGPGMPAAVQEKVFNPFFTTKEVGQGTGMGMSISYQIIVDKHQGQLTCESGPDQGTEFTIRLPYQASSTNVRPREA
ncbi:GHKL domain-containing protein [filamentous cyanobacterium LEGE 11480]|uniref:histidine kinase n=1 Tax=Romeriopsis navalis LEGE 11480 TaxID=2777977 RepID=A0A928Z465_9CYAN|nr:ATP-binding protein [Romeriopsis navalis]MBE9032251.1 GHKL domain-containing protein [Romeriopsis navalis LEGE 11480]